MALFSHVQILMSVVIVSLAAQRLSPIKIDPSAPTVDVGKSIALRAVDDAGQVVAAKWSISDPLVASISAQGVVTGRAAGRAVVRARSKNSLAETTVTVQAIETALPLFEFLESPATVLLSTAIALAFNGTVDDHRAFAQPRLEQGRSIGTIATQGDLIVMTLDEGVLGSANLFDLSRRTLRFTPVAGGYRGENLPLEWDGEFGAEMSGAPLTIQNFAFPFSGQSWKQLSVGVTGSITFGASGAAPPGPAGGGGRGGGVAIGRFDQLQNAAPLLVNTSPAICVFMKPRMSGTRYVKELPDRVVITWSLTEPVGGIQDFTWAPTVNRFQAVLRKDGAIDLSYEQIAAKDAIVGIYPMVTAGKAKAIASLNDPDDAAIPAHLDVKRMTVAAVDGVFLRVSFDTRGPVLPDGDAASNGAVYQVTFDSPTPNPDTKLARPVVWTIRGGPAGGRGGGTVRYISSGDGVLPAVRISSNTISVQGMLPAGLGTSGRVMISGEARAESPASGAVDQLAVRAVTLSDVMSPRFDL